MNISIRRIKREETHIADDMLTKLIQDERKYNPNINENFKVESFYENYINNEKICLLVALDENKIIGYIYGYILEEGATVKEKTVKLDAIYIEPEYRHYGIGDMLIENFKSWVKEKDIQLIEVSVCNGNIVARNLYKKHGFTNEIKTTLLLNMNE